MSHLYEIYVIVYRQKFRTSHSSIESKEEIEDKSNVFDDMIIELWCYFQTMDSTSTPQICLQIYFRGIVLA